MAYQKLLARRDLSLTHTLVHPTVDRAWGDAPAAGNDVALQKVADTAHGIVVRGARILATLAPFADELAVYPAAPLPPGADAYALSFSIPMATPGLKFLCRDSMSARNAVDHPLSSRFDEQDAFVIFDDVEVPRDRVFIDANPQVYNTAVATSWPPNFMQQTSIRAQTKLEFAWGIATRMLEATNGLTPATAEMLGEIWSYAELTRAAVLAAEAGAHEWGNGVWFPAGEPFRALRGLLPLWFPRVNEIIRQLGSHNLLAAPTVAQMTDPGAAAPDRPLPARRRAGHRPGSRADLPPGVGLRGQRAGQPRRAVRALLHRLERALVPGRAHAGLTRARAPAGGPLRQGRALARMIRGRATPVPSPCARSRIMRARNVLE